jgi:hypothetical protein
MIIRLGKARILPRVAPLLQAIPIQLPRPRIRIRRLPQVDISGLADERPEILHPCLIHRELGLTALRARPGNSNSF